MVRRMEITAIYGGTEIPVHYGMAINRKSQQNKINRAMYAAHIMPGKVRIMNFRYDSDRENGIYGGDITEKEMYWDGAYIRSKKPQKTRRRVAV